MYLLIIVNRAFGLVFEQLLLVDRKQWTDEKINVPEKHHQLLSLSRFSRNEPTPSVPHQKHRPDTRAFIPPRSASDLMCVACQFPGCAFQPSNSGKNWIGCWQWKLLSMNAFYIVLAGTHNTSGERNPAGKRK